MPRDIAIVLSGGGTYLYAHIGLLEAFEDAGLINDRANNYEQHQQIHTVAGTSAGSMVGAFLAAGYPPHEMWKLAHWRVWGGTPPDDPNDVFSNPAKADLAGLLDLDWTGIEAAVTTNINRFKGFIRGKNIIDTLARYMYIQRDARSLYPQSEYERSPYVLPPHLRKELYIVACNINNARETLFHFTEHMGDAQIPAAGMRLDMSLGREVNYAVYRDSLAAGKPPEQVMTIPEAIRCSFSIPTVFRPYYKVLPFQRGGTTRLVGAYYSDGSARDDFPISAAAKVARCKRIFGVYLGYPEYPFHGIGQTPLTTILLRIVNTLMMQTIYEADQDDAELMQLPIRVAVPSFRGAELLSDAVLDTRVAIAARRAGYIAGAYCLYLTRWAMDGIQPNPRSFVEGLLERGKNPRAVPLATWDELFSEKLEQSLGEPAQGRTFTGGGSASPASVVSRYYTLAPMGNSAGDAFYEAASAVFAERVSAPKHVAAANYDEGDQIDLDYTALETSSTDSNAQKQFARIRDVARNAALILLVCLLFTVVLPLLALAYSVLGMSLSALEVILTLVVAILAAWLLFPLAVRIVWEQLQKYIRKQLAI